MDNIQQTLKFRISYPFSRVNIKDSFEELADFEKQQKMWNKNNSQSLCSYWNNLWIHALEALYEDCDLDEYKEENIGKYFYNGEEAKQVHQFCEWLYNLTVEIGGDKPDSAYLNHPEWHKVCSGAKKLFELMDANDKKYNFNEEYEAYNKAEWEETYGEK